MDVATNPRRKALTAAVCSLCGEAGFEACERSAVETLTEMLQSCISEIGRSTRAYSELAGRTEPVVGDVVMALVEMGLEVDSIAGYARRANRSTVPTPSTAGPPQIPRILQVGQKRTHPQHIPEHLPSFPDPHAYIRTPTYKQPTSEYEAIREKAASQKRDVERALTRFIAKTGDTHTLFHDDTHLFPLIASKCVSQPYLNALLPRDQMFEEDPDLQKDSKKDSENERLVSDMMGAGGKDESDAIDNPYLRPVKIPKKKKR
jgi:transcription initiation factor TFIID subunit 8